MWVESRSHEASDRLSNILPRRRLEVGNVKAADNERPTRRETLRVATGAERRQGISRCAERDDPSLTHRESGVLETSEEVVAFEVGIVGEDFFEGHARGEKLDEL